MKYYYPALISLILINAIFSLVYAQSGALDPTFGVNGFFSLQPKISNVQSRDVALTTDGKILSLVMVASSSPGGWDNFLLRYLADGSADLSFGDSSMLKILTDEIEMASAVIVDASNRILVLAREEDYYSSTIYIYRFMEDGSEDGSFGNNGEVKTKLTEANNALLLQPDGKILVAGETGFNGMVQRFNEDGSPDLSFNQTGKVMLNLGNKTFALGITQNNDGKILITGSVDDNLFLVRLLNDGSPDNTFGVNGLVVIDNGGNEDGNDIALMQDEKIIVTGYSATTFKSSFTCWRFLPDGSPDNSFGNNGFVILDSDSYFNVGWFVLSDADSSVIVGGSVYNGVTNDPVLYRLLNDGSKDVTFGTNGTGGKTFVSADNIEVNGVRSTDGNIILSGTKADNGNNLNAVSRFLPNGLTDISFAINGTVALQNTYTPYVNEVNQLTQLSDGKILCTGIMGQSKMVLFRLMTDGTLDLSYGQNGLLIPDGERFDFHSFISASDAGMYMVVDYQPLSFINENDFFGDQVYRLAIFKLHPDGSIDSSYAFSGMAQPFFSDYLLQQCESIAIQADGKLLLSGQIYTGISTGGFGDTNDAYLIRLNQDGTIDNLFGNQGIMVLDFAFRDIRPNAVALPDGRFIYEEIASDSILPSVTRVLRFMADGSPDQAFGTNGSITLNINTPLSTIDYKRDLLVQPDQKLLLRTIKYLGLNEYKSILRLKESGSIDSTFGTNGFASIDALQFSNFPEFAVQPDKKILLLGFAPAPYGSLTVARMLENGSIDSSFGVNGIAPVDTPDYISGKTIQLQTDGKILVGGDRSSDFYFYVARMLNDIATGIEENKSDLFLKVFPNPVSDQLILQTSFSSDKEASITITNSLGQNVKQQRVKFSNDKINIDVNDLTCGIYLTTLKSSAGTASIKFVKY